MPRDMKRLEQLHFNLPIVIKIGGHRFSEIKYGSYPEQDGPLVSMLGISVTSFSTRICTCGIGRGIGRSENQQTKAVTVNSMGQIILGVFIKSKGSISSANKTHAIRPGKQGKSRRACPQLGEGETLPASIDCRALGWWSVFPRK
jgi:hypothetical protein